MKNNKTNPRTYPTGVMFQQLKPMIYKYAYENNIPFLKEERDYFKLPPVIYGDTNEKAQHMFSYFTNSNESVGIFLVGQAGSGKTLMAEVISNIGIDYGYPVVYVAGVEIKDDDIKFFYTLNNCIILIDEFSKIFSYHKQKNILSLLTDKSKSILWILTDNTKEDVNRFMLSRPGRIRYLLKFGKLDRRVFDGYVKDANLLPVFEEELRDVYEEADVFTFDHLQALITEHKFSPSMDLKSMMDIMNLGNLESITRLKIVKVEYLGREIPLFRSLIKKQNEDVIIEDNVISNIINLSFTIDLSGAKASMVKTRYGDVTDTWKESFYMPDAYQPYDKTLLNLDMRSRSKSSEVTVPRSVFKVLLEEPNRLSIVYGYNLGMSPNVEELLTSYLKERYSDISRSESDELFNARLKLNPFSIGDESNDILPLNKIKDSKDAIDLLDEPLVGQMGGYQTSDKGTILKYSNTYISIYFGLYKDTGEPLIYNP